ncbi:hypothetical protein TDB9533_03898 [Thalassocella blandensis]|nr:hypothetical protein TDB9533_03898 [Thalassocella blandensis]
MLALVALASNSILCRLALAEEEIDAASFTVIRMLSGVAALAFLLFLSGRKSNVNSASTSEHSATGSWHAAFMLLLYAIAFSYAYVSLDTGVGALILFGSVQITIICVGLISGQKLHVLEWFGVGLAFAGFTYLVLPGAAAPSILGLFLMSTAGIAWGFYTLAGKKSKNPFRDTTFNFFRTVPVVIALALYAVTQADISLRGVILAMLSGAIASGLGYTLWYTVLAWLTAIQAGVLQLLIPVIAAVGGIIFANEILTLRFVLSSVMILTGILIVIFGKYSVTCLHRKNLK